MNTQNKSAIDIVNYALSTVKNTERDGDFKQISYMEWAGREVLMLLYRHPDIPPLNTIEIFEDKMLTYSRINPQTSCAFSCAKDMAEWIVDLLIS